jgi:lysozyme family protein/peptidoglycan hydrolase-like protein with peptidoglycan-binding domain
MNTFEQLKPEYEALLWQMRITQAEQALAVAGKLLKTKAMYVEASVKTGVPLAWLMAINERESGGRLDAYLGDGEPLNRVTHNVPRGRGPFPTWVAGAIDALQYDHVAGIADWTWARALYEAELWNGFGYRSHGVHSAYLWAGTNIYSGGKFASDGHYDPHMWDTQLGVVPLFMALIKLDPSLQFEGGFPEGVTPPVVAPSPLNAEGEGVTWLQDVLNYILGARLRVDGSYGRMTSTAVRSFQVKAGLAPDGLAGPETVAALKAAMATPEAPTPAVEPQETVAPAPPPVPPVQGLPITLLSVDTPAPIGHVYPIYDHDLALFCRYIYQYPGDPMVTWDMFDAGEDDTVCYAIKRIGDIDVVVCRGSTTLPDWVNDAEAWARINADVKDLGPIHIGFNTGLKKVRDEVLARDPKYLITTGHSLGAARASILAGYFKQAGKPPLSTVVFGEPRPGYGQLADYLKDIPGRNYRNGSGINGDLVTAVPFTAPLLPWTNSRAFTELNQPPEPSDPWGPFSWHHVTLYTQALSTINTGTSP